MSDNLDPLERARQRRARREAEAAERDALLEAMTEAERGLRLAIWRAHSGDVPITAGELQRRIFVTPFAGAYGDAGAVLVIEGSPPHGGYAIMGKGEACAVVFDLSTNTSRGRAPISHWGPKARQPLRRAILAYLAEVATGAGWSNRV